MTKFFSNARILAELETGEVVELNTTLTASGDLFSWWEPSPYPYCPPALMSEMHVNKETIRVLNQKLKIVKILSKLDWVVKN